MGKGSSERHTSVVHLGIYPSMPRILGTGRVRRALENRVVIKRKNRHILKCLEKCLQNNIFEFYYSVYIQSHNKFGPEMAPSWAGLGMGLFKEMMKEKFTEKPFIWKRYIDDTWGLWDKREPSCRI